MESRIQGMTIMPPRMQHTRLEKLHWQIRPKVHETCLHLESGFLELDGFEAFALPAKPFHHQLKDAKHRRNLA